MSDITYTEQLKLEKLLNMSSGFVLNFTNRTFAEFIEAYTTIDIFDEKYNINSGSKANRLRAFWKIESNSNVGILINAFINYIYEVCSQELSLYNDVPTDDLIAECKVIANRLLKNTSVPNMHILTNIESIDSQELQQDIKQQIEQGKPTLAIDRLHTLLVKFFREKCTRYSLSVPKDIPLHSLFGMYVKEIEKTQVIQSDMSISILKTSISLFDKFNFVRNNQSYAHDNQVLNYDESIFIVNNIFNIIQFITVIEQKINLVHQNNMMPSLDDIPF